MSIWGAVLNSIPVVLLLVALVLWGSNGWKVPNYAAAIAAAEAPSNSPSPDPTETTDVAAAPPAPVEGHYAMWVSSCGDNLDKLKSNGTAFNVTAGTRSGTDQLSPNTCDWTKTVTTEGFDTLYVSGQLQGTGVLACWITDTDTGEKLVEHVTNSEYGVVSCSIPVGSF